MLTDVTLSTTEVVFREKTACFPLERFPRSETGLCLFTFLTVGETLLHHIVSCLSSPSIHLKMFINDWASYKTSLVEQSTFNSKPFHSSFKYAETILSLRIYPHRRSLSLDLSTCFKQPNLTPVTPPIFHPHHYPIMAETVEFWVNWHSCLL